MALAVLLVLLTGCLVTEPWTPPEQVNVPPIIQADPSNPNSPKIGSIVWLNSKDEAQHEWEFAVQVIEVDVLRPLEARWRIVKQNDRSPAYATLPTLEAGQRIRPVKIKVTSTQLTYNECHHLELAVSGSFFNDKIAGLDPRLLFDVTVPRKEEDLALASWWIWEGRGTMMTFQEDKIRVMDSCKALENVPSTSATTQELQ